VFASAGLAAFQGTSLPASLFFLGLVFLFFEWSALTSIALTGSSYDASIRMQMISVMLTTMAVSRSVGAVVAEPLFELLDGFGGICSVAACSQLVAAFVFFATRPEAQEAWAERDQKEGATELVEGAI
jgi:hypothetical protein